jgi:lipopolysaccharide/colanic/teichoic acid biosynthesis glycosyltransferase
LLLIDAVLINIAFMLSFLARYGLPFPQRNFDPYRRSLVFLTVIYVLALAFSKVYKGRFRSSWELFKRVFTGLFLGTLLSVAFVYTFRIKWGAFPTSVFALSFFINLLLIFKVNQLALRFKKRIRKRVVVIGEGDVDGIGLRKADVERMRVDEIKDLINCGDIDEILISDRIQNGQNLNLLIYLVQKLRTRVVFSPSSYLALLPERINGNSSISFLNTFIGRRPDVEEFFIRSFDIAASALILLTSLPLTALISLLIKVSSPGPALYRQQRVGKDGKIFTLYKFRTMVEDAEKQVGPVWASRNDPRVTSVGRVLRTARLDELPQLTNVIRGDLSLVGPRPERPHFVKLHKALRELRLAVKPGVTGLAQIRSFYDLKPKHKIKYDYLYIQQRSLILNLYILAKTVPVVFSRKGW